MMLSGRESRPPVGWVVTAVVAVVLLYLLWKLQHYQREWRRKCDREDLLRELHRGFFRQVQAMLSSSPGPPSPPGSAAPHPLMYIPQALLSYPRRAPSRALLLRPESLSGKVYPNRTALYAPPSLCNRLITTVTSVEASGGSAHG